MNTLFLASPARFKHIEGDHIQAISILTKQQIYLVTNDPDTAGTQCHVIQFDHRLEGLIIYSVS